MVDCGTCNGAGWLLRLAKPGETGTVFTQHGPGRLFRCPACNGDDHQQAYLQSICGLEGEELGFTFENYWTTGQRGKALEAAKDVMDNKGWLTIDGRYGTGKTYLLAAIVNEARARGLMAIYSPMAFLLDHLRNAFRPEAGEVGFDALWENILKCDVLCLDEVQDYNPTPWADERCKMLFIDRYRRWPDTVTVVATSDIGNLPGLLKSRAMDKRFKTIMLGGTDVRPELQR